MSGRSLAKASAIPAMHRDVASALSRGASPSASIDTRSSTLKPSASISLTVMPYCGIRCMLVATICSSTSGARRSSAATGWSSPQSALAEVTMHIFLFSISMQSYEKSFTHL